MVHMCLKKIRTAKKLVPINTLYTMPCTKGEQEHAELSQQQRNTQQEIFSLKGLKSPKAFEPQ